MLLLIVIKHSIIFSTFQFMTNYNQRLNHTITISKHTKKLTRATCANSLKTTWIGNKKISVLFISGTHLYNYQC